jgi:hypothetical protein
VAAKVGISISTLDRSSSIRFFTLPARFIMSQRTGRAASTPRPEMQPGSVDEQVKLVGGGEIDLRGEQRLWI